MSNLTHLMTHISLHQNGNPIIDSLMGAGNGTSQETTSASHVEKLSLEDLETFRTQEIMAKASSGLILLLLKWFKVSHILKFEYMTQLLVDANFIPIVLKLFQTQETNKIINYRMDRAEYAFFQYCFKISRNWREEPEPQPSESLTQPEPEIEPPKPDGSEIIVESDDEACPPPIARHRTAEVKPPEIQKSDDSADGTKSTSLIWPEVDELGVPTTAFPAERITNFSWRNFFSSINYLRVLQKVCKNKAHRNLMLVTYKSAAYLKKSLKIPQRELRLYTLKLFKNQVPYCGRKWRSSNMRVITAVYLYCRPELRDDWLLSGDVDNDVEQAVPMEQSLRSLTHFYNLKHYATQMGAAEDVLGEGTRDFFVRELERMDWSELINGDDAESMASGLDLYGGSWGQGVHPLEHM
jgi:hypothetical protein